MFIEPVIKGEKHGWIEVICGSMFSGKTEELIRRIKRVKIANQVFQMFKPACDTRYHKESIISHDTNYIDSTPVEYAKEILDLVDNAEVVGVDEIQFFEADIITVANSLAAKGVRVIVAGLDMDFKGAPFGSMPQLIAKAEFVTKLHAICMVCGNVANFSYRKSASDEKILLGEKDEYEALCRRCYNAKIAQK